MNTASLIKTLIFLVIVCVLFQPYMVFAATSADSLIGNALNYYNKGNYRDALQELGKVLILEPGNEQVKYYIRQAREKQADVEAVSRSAKVSHILDDHTKSNISPSESRRVILGREFGGKKVKKIKKGLARNNGKTSFCLNGEMRESEGTKKKKVSRVVLR